MKKYSNIHIILDGADGVGKTTVVNLLSEKLNIPIIKMKGMSRYFKKNPEEASQIFNETVIQFKDFPFIQDRGWTSSIVYSIAYKRKLKDVMYLAGIIGELNEKVFFLVRDEPFRKDVLVKNRKWKKLNTIFSEANRADNPFNIKVNIIQVGNKKPTEICQEILKKL